MLDRTLPPPDYFALVDDLVARHAGVAASLMFGMPVRKCNGTAFAGSYAGGAVFKLTPDAVVSALELPGLCWPIRPAKGDR